MNYRVFILASFLVFSFFFFPIDAKMNFERNIWVYWETNFDQAPLITRISYEKLLKAAQKTDWKVILVNGSNIKNYLKDYERFENIVKKGYRQTVQQKSDILRISLVQQNGGVWIDFACILFDDLEWLNNQESYKHMIINRIGKNLDDPDMFMLGEGWHQSPLSYYNENNSLVTDEYFGMAIHFIAAKKKSKIMTEWKQKMYKICQIDHDQLMKQIRQKRLYFHNIDRNDMYYSGNIALQSLIQQKQQQLDNQLYFNFRNRKNVYEQYKIWSIHGEVGPIAMTRKHGLRQRDLFMETKEEIEQRLGRLWFYLKMAKYLRQRIEEMRMPSEEYFKNNGQLTIDEILQRGPTVKECSLYYIVKGSILYNFFEGSKYQKEIHAPFITVEQRQQMRKHCQFIAPYIYYSWYSFKSEGQMTKPQRQIFYYQEQSQLFHAVRIFWLTHRLVIYAGLEQWRAIMFTLIIYIILRNSSAKDLLKAFLDKYRNEYNEKVPFQELMKSRMNTLQNTFAKIGQPVEYKVIKWSKHKSMNLLIISMKTILGSISLQFYENIQDLGRFPQYELTFFIILFIIFTDKWIDSLLEDYQQFKKEDEFFLTQTINQVSQFVIYIPLGFVFFIHFDILYGMAYYHSVVLVGGSLLMDSMLRHLQRESIKNWFSQYLKYIIPTCKYIGLGIFLLFYFSVNLRYLRQDNHYMKQSISDYCVDVFWIGFAVFVFILNFSLILQKIPQTQSRANSQEFNKFLRSKWKHRFISTNLIVLIILKSYFIFWEIKENQTSHNTFITFQVILILFSACGLSVEAKIPQQLDFRRKFTLYLFIYFIPFLYLLFGLQILDSIFINWVVNLLIMMGLCAWLAGVGFIVEQLNCKQVQDNQSKYQVEYSSLQTHQEIKSQRNTLTRE